VIKKEDILKSVRAVAESTSTDVYVVGGYVRDQLLGFHEKKDIDFVVLGSGLAFGEALAAHYGDEAGSLIPFPDFDTSRFVFTRDLEEGGKEVLYEVEFAGARKEKYDDESRKPTVESATLEEDLSRRDFTVNAMAQQVLSGGTLGDVIDPHHGKEDLSAKIIKTPLDSDETFSEDPLRMLRAARFAAQLGFVIDPATLKAVSDNRTRLSIISKERILEELMKLLGTGKPSIGLEILYGTKLIDEFLPEVPKLAGAESSAGYSHKDNFAHTLAVVDSIREQGGNALLAYAGLMHDIAKPDVKKFVKGRGWTFDMHEHLGRKMVRSIGKRLRMSKDDTEYVAKLVRWHLQPIALMDAGVTDSPVRRLIVNLEDDLQDLLILCRADITTGNQKKKAKRLKNYDYLDQRIGEVMDRDKLRAFQSPVRGEEIMKVCGLKPGPTVGKIKKRIEDAILDGEIPNEYDQAREYFERIKDEYLAEVGEWEKVV